MVILVTIIAMVLMEQFALSKKLSESLAQHLVYVLCTCFYWNMYLLVCLVIRRGVAMVTSQVISIAVSLVREIESH